MQPKFLLDENVRHELFVFLKSKDLDVKTIPTGSTDLKVADISKKESRVLITNDKDFEFASKLELYAVILLKIHQADKESLLKSFEKLLDKNINFEGKSVQLSSENQEVSNLE